MAKVDRRLLNRKNRQPRLIRGDRLECLGVEIQDHSSELGEEGLRIEVVGIPHPFYAELFPAHMEAYRKQFEK